MASAFYTLAHRVLPMRASADPLGTWEALAGPGWSAWLARASVLMEESLRGVGVDGAVEGRAVHVVDGVEMIAITFPVPSGPGEPFFAVLARSAAHPAPRAFVFEMGIPDGESPLPRVVMAEWRIKSADDMMRVRYDVEPDMSLAACLRRTAREMNGAPAAPRPPVGPAPLPNGGWGIFAAIVGGVVALGALAVVVLTRM